MKHLTAHLSRHKENESDSANSDLKSFSWERSEKFVLIEASKLSLDDDFLKYEPQTKKQENFKHTLVAVIEKGVKDFWKPRMDPSFTPKGDGICFEFFRKPAVGKTYKWWKRAAKRYCPERRSRLGTFDEYIAFLAVLMKMLLKNGLPLEKVWHMICDDSTDVGHFMTNIKELPELENVGTKEVLGFFDLGNTHKMLKWNGEKGGLCVAGGCYEVFGYDFPVSKIILRVFYPNIADSTVGWVVLSK
jgi:hypothetical protein